MSLKAPDEYVGVLNVEFIRCVDALEDKDVVYQAGEPRKLLHVVCMNPFVAKNESGISGSA